jgi:hypothetical protein
MTCSPASAASTYSQERRAAVEYDSTLAQPLNQEPTMLRFAIAIVVATVTTLNLYAQEKSVNPGINTSFEKPSVPEFVERFERDGRDAFDNRKAVLAALELKSRRCGRFTGP